MRVITINVNGIRAAARKGFFDWLETQNADVVCIQETKAQEHQLDDEIFCPNGYHCYYNDAQRKGYSGTAIYSRIKPQKITSSLGWDPCDSEGRYLQVDFPGISVVSMYVPSGSSSDEALAKKLDFHKRIYPHFKSLRRKRREFILCADWNTCHKPIDLKNWKANQKNSGFLPVERAWLDSLFDELGYVDGFRLLNQDEGEYTWWSNRGRAWDNNVGWRLDYHLLTPGLTPHAKAVSVYRDERFSDHAPVSMDFDWPLPEAGG
ncbi:MAG: exodeoxyribonuclease III [Gammaproteobacteria bacterium]|nr:exodeoxyribonuclease III [Gammaproteobacteria bacterium]NND38773.1 exodeoxyribonuclease III [Pseudomonadales bacterium]MBT8150661.1 exodeoxyribonuclease III [Gammaproteobacteria bacterium]NNL11687.1 exodeoxyribonuclease III [Pseudomonadales bacterium]NNM12371.1 exodeoxyribonuclease III [Pseudomonadales bacterium]